MLGVVFLGEHGLDRAQFQCDQPQALALDPRNHFADQTARYAGGTLRPVYFHPDELKGHVAREYRPGR